MSQHTERHIMTIKNENLNELIQTASDEGKGRGAIEGYLQFQHGLSVNESKALLNEVLGETSTISADWSETITFIRKNYGTVEKKELIEGMMKLKGGTKASMNHAYNYIKFAQEYAAQEVVASTEEEA